jgi:hypothetical protein
MAARDPGSYQALNQTSGLPQHWWQRVPQPVATRAVRAWSVLPHAIRARFIPLGRRINPRRSTRAVSVGPGPDTVPGVADLRAQGYEPIEHYTGAVGVGRLWPQNHRASVPETRSVWLADPSSDGRLWMVRSPWPTLSLQDSLNVLWTWVERDHASLDEDLWRERVSEALAWDETTAATWHRQPGR